MADDMDGGGGMAASGEIAGGPAGVSAGGDEMVDVGPPGGLRASCCCKDRKSLCMLVMAPVRCATCCAKAVKASAG
jgi:hypothetical protein